MLKNKSLKNNMLSLSNQLVILNGKKNFDIKKSFLSSFDKQLERFLEGGLRFGELCEWGSPWGLAGREVILSFLSYPKESPLWSIWIQSKSGIDINAPAWTSRGVNLKYTRFAYSKDVLKELKPIFLDPFFKVIIIDSPTNFTPQDCAFLARQAKLNNQVIILLRDYFLTPRIGNIWAKLRLNCWKDDQTQKLCIKVVRGLSPRQLVLTDKEALC